MVAAAGTLEVPTTGLQQLISSRLCLGGTQSFRPTVDERCLSAPQRVGAVTGAVKPEPLDPRIYNAGVLSGRQMSGSADPAWEQGILRR